MVSMVSNTSIKGTQGRDGRGSILSREDAFFYGFHKRLALSGAKGEKLSEISSLAEKLASFHEKTAAMDKKALALTTALLAASLGTVAWDVGKALFSGGGESSPPPQPPPGWGGGPGQMGSPVALQPQGMPQMQQGQDLPGQPGKAQDDFWKGTSYLSSGGASAGNFTPFSSRAGQGQHRYGS